MHTHFWIKNLLDDAGTNEIKQKTGLKEAGC
jgi:hypothetical protein